MITQSIFILSILLVGFALKSVMISLSSAFSVENYKIRFEETQTLTQLLELYEEVLLYSREQKREETLKLLEEIEKRISHFK